MNQRPSAYEADELPDCSIPLHHYTLFFELCQSKATKNRVGQKKPSVAADLNCPIWESHSPALSCFQSPPVGGTYIVHQNPWNVKWFREESFHLTRGHLKAILDHHERERTSHNHNAIVGSIWSPGSGRHHLCLGRGFPDCAVRKICGPAEPQHIVVWPSLPIDQNQSKYQRGRKGKSAL